jgi:hypothetical protein
METGMIPQQPSQSVLIFGGYFVFCGANRFLHQNTQNMKSFIIRQAAKWISKRVDKQAQQAVADQQALFQRLILQGRETAFGRDHGFAAIHKPADYHRQVPIQDYEDLRPYIERVIGGEHDVLWPGKPKYFAKTSGTTSGVKYIPISKDSVSNHFGTARNAVFHYIAKQQKSSFLNGKMIFLSGSPELDKKGGILTGRLSGISNHLVPGWLRGNQLPSYTTNCIEDWEQKVDAIVRETVGKDLRLISGIPPWVQMYYERLLAYTGKKTVKEVFPNFSLFVYGGVNYEPYRASLEALVGERVDSLETYPASEGFIAFQDRQGDPGLLLNTNSGIYFEFIPADQYFEKNPPRLSLAEVELGVNYALILNTNAGLWSYSIGDTVQFVEKNPYRIVVSGRIKHFISAFGEHVIGKEVEQAMLEVAGRHGVKIVEFTVAPQIQPLEGGLPYHEWLVEFEQEPKDMEAFALDLDAAMQKQNIYYQDLIEGKILRTARVRALPKDAFREYMKSIGKLGGQNKVPRLSNDRKIAEVLLGF